MEETDRCAELTDIKAAEWTANSQQGTFCHLRFGPVARGLLQDASSQVRKALRSLPPPPPPPAPPRPRCPPPRATVRRSVFVPPAPAPHPRPARRELPHRIANR